MADILPEVKTIFQIPLTWVIELRDTGDWGFLLPPNQIKPTAEEMTNAFIELGRELRNEKSACKSKLGQ